MVHNQKGFSLPEMLVSIAISAIIMGAAFGSYTVIQNNFDWQNDMKSIGQSARAITNIINKDVRMAGYKDSDGSNITDAVTIRDCPGGVGCTGNLDEITVVYDESSTVRRRITYYATPFPIGSTDGRNRLMRRLETCDPGVCNFTEVYDEPVADYIEDLQFVGTRGNCPTDGSIVAGCGSKSWFRPDECASPADDYDNFPTRFASHTSNRNLSCGCDVNSFDGDMNTVFSCGVKDSPKNDWGITSFSFNDPVIIQKVKLSTSAHLGCYMLFGQCRTNYAGPGLNEYYGTAPRSWKYDFAIYTLNYNNNQWSDLNGVLGGTMQTNGELPGVKEFDLQTHTGINWITLRMSKPKGYNWVSGQIIGIDGGHLPIQLPEIEFYGEKFSSTPTPSEVETSVLIRSPNEHGNSERSVGSGITLGNRTDIQWNDRYLRDWFTSSVVIRNVHYQSQM